MMVTRTVTRDEIAKYCEKIKKVLARRGLAVGRIYPSIRGEIENFLTESPLVTMKEVMARFGTPESYVRAYIETMQPEEYCKAMDYARFRKKVCLVTAALVVLIAGVTALWIMIRVDNGVCEYIRVIGPVLWGIDRRGSL